MSKCDAVSRRAQSTLVCFKGPPDTATESLIANNTPTEHFDACSDKRGSVSSTANKTAQTQRTTSGAYVNSSMAKKKCHDLCGVSTYISKRAGTANKRLFCGEPMVRYVRPTQQEKRKQLYAYHAAKGILARESKMSEKVSLDSVGHLNSLAANNTTSKASDTTTATVTTRNASVANSFGEACGLNFAAADGKVPGERAGAADAMYLRSSHALEDSSGTDSSRGRLVGKLRHLVHLYEKHHDRLLERPSKKELSVCELLPLTDSSYDVQQQHGEDTCNTKCAGTDKTWGAEMGLNQKGELQQPHRNNNRDDFSGTTLNSTAVRASLETISNMDAHMLMNLPKPFWPECDLCEEKCCDLLAAERERFSKSVRKHLLSTLRCFDIASRVSKGAKGCDENLSSQGMGLHSLIIEGMSGVPEVFFDTSLEATPYTHVKRLLSYLANEPTVQKSAEAAARLATYVLMSSLPEEIYKGDPEEYRFLRERARRAATPSAPPLSVSVQSGLEKCTVTPISLQLSRQSVSLSPLPRHSQSRKSFEVTGKTTASYGDILTKNKEYFFHQSSVTLAHAVQSVALKKGIWLSSTIPMMHRPPLHACGLPLRAARDITLWQRPPSSMDCEEERGESRMSYYQKEHGQTSNTNTDATNNYSTFQKINWSAVEDDLRPKMLAPLLIIGNGGYGVAPFSTVDEGHGFIELMKKKGDKPCLFNTKNNDNTYTGDNDTFNNNNSALREGDEVLYAMSNLLRPEPSLLPLHSVMKLISQSVRDNRRVSIDEVDPTVSPIVFDLLMDFVQNYEFCFQSILRMTFESASLKSFFINTYRETLLSWASIVVCESAMEYAAERAGQGPAGVSWTKGVIPTIFTEDQLEEIAFSGLVEKAFPSMTQWGYDEQLFRHTINTLRSVVFEALGRVKGELYFLLSGVDKRSIILENYCEEMNNAWKMEAKLKTETGDLLQTDISSGGKKGSTDEFMEESFALPALSHSCGHIEGDRSQHLSSLRMFKTVVQLSNSSSHNCQDASYFFPFLADEGLGSCGGRNSTKFSSVCAVPQCNHSLYGSMQNTHNNSLSASQNVLIRRLTAKPQQENDERNISDFFRSGLTCSSSNTQMICDENVCISALHSSMGLQQGQGIKGAKVEKEKVVNAFMTPTSKSLTQTKLGGLSSRTNIFDIPESLSVRSVRRDLISLKFKRHQKIGPLPTLNANEAPSPSISPLFTPSAPPTPIPEVTSVSPLFFAKSPVSAIMQETKEPTEGAGDTTLAFVVGPKRAAAVSRMRRACENTMQFYMHFQNALNCEKDTTHFTPTDTQWYATGSMGFFERRCVAAIKRSRQVAAFDLRYISPITALCKCALWPFDQLGQSIADNDKEKEHQQQQYTLRPKELHLGETIVPWTL